MTILERMVFEMNPFDIEDDVECAELKGPAHMMWISLQKKFSDVTSKYHFCLASCPCCDVDFIVEHNQDFGDTEPGMICSECSEHEY